MQRRSVRRVGSIGDAHFQLINDHLAGLPQRCGIHAASRPGVTLRDHDALLVDEVDELHQRSIDRLLRTPIQRNHDRLSGLHGRPIDLCTQQFDLAVKSHVERLGDLGRIDPGWRGIGGHEVAEEGDKRKNKGSYGNSVTRNH